MPWLTASAADSYRPASEDRVGIWPTPYGHLLAVADGMGGRPGGGRAAEFALGQFEAFAEAPTLPTPRDCCSWLTRIDQATSGDGDGETTLVVCCVADRSLTGAAVGDSAAWWVTG